MKRGTFINAAGAATMLTALPIGALADEFSYDLTTPTGTIFGTALLPSNATKAPVALIVAGSGPIDRNGNAPTLQLNMYRKLAASLAEHGIASVRYDKRGIAASRAAGPPEADLRFETLADDVAAWIVRLRADARFSHIAIVGHSEGSLLGMLAVQRAPVDSYISVEGPGFPLATLLRTQLKPQLQPYPDLATKVERVIAALSAGKTIDVGDLPAQMMPLFRSSIQPYLISSFKYDPRTEIKKLTGRIAIIQGTHDVQVPVEDGRSLAAASPAAAFAVIDTMTHMLTDDPGTTLAQQLTGAYVDATRPIDANLIRTLVTAVSGG